jgi:hypothetical protein
MYGSIRRYRIRSGNFNEIVNRVKEGLVPLLEKTPGFVGYYVINTNDSKATSFTICENQAAVDAANHVALDWVKRTLGNQLSDPEVLAGDLPIALVHQHA